MKSAVKCLLGWWLLFVVASLIDLQAAAAEYVHTLPLRNGHATLTCTACHEQGPLRTPARGTTCVACHAPVHTSQSKDCAACHGEIRWRGLAPEVGHRAHAQTRLPILEGDTHREVLCERCHGPGRPRPAPACQGCHEDPHAGALTRYGGCATCHQPAGFRRVTFGLAAHAQTKFPLQGRHRAMPCVGCHGASRPKRSLAVPERRCADCHVSPETGHFVAETLAQGCEGCHVDAAWTQVTQPHPAWPLDGAHVAVACQACHGTRGKAPPRRCEGCHTDVHAGQFQQAAPVRGCDACHTTERFAPGFDHATRTALPLQGAHAQLACARCHPATTLANGTVVTRYRLASARCDSCHAGPHRATLTAEGRPLDCRGCHDARGWQLNSAPPPGFDHAGVGFALEGAHQGTTCVACHRDAQSTRAACASCHRDPHGKRLGPACEQCHDAQSWRPAEALALHRATRLPLTGRHAVIACAACHTQRAARGVAVTSGATPVDCYACHRKAYHRDNHPDHNGDAAAMRAPLARACGTCHSTASWRGALRSAPATLTQARTRAAHVQYLALVGGHDVACAQCHVQPGGRVQCQGCHPSTSLVRVHGRMVPLAAAACLACHPQGRKAALGFGGRP